MYQHTKFHLNRSKATLSKCWFNKFSSPFFHWGGEVVAQFYQIVRPIDAKFGKNIWTRHGRFPSLFSMSETLLRFWMLATNAGVKNRSPIWEHYTPCKIRKGLGEMSQLIFEFCLCLNLGQWRLRGRRGRERSRNSWKEDLETKKCGRRASFKVGGWWRQEARVQGRAGRSEVVRGL